MSYGQVYSQDAVEVEVELRPEQLNWIKVGDKVIIFKGSREIPAKITRIASSLNPGSRLAQVFIKAESARDLVIGEFVDLRITGADIDSAYRVPMECFQDEGFLWIAVKDKDELFLERYQPEVLSILSNKKLLLADDKEIRVICKNNPNWREGRKLKVASNG